MHCFDQKAVERRRKCTEFRGLSECFSYICFRLCGADFDDFRSNLLHQVKRMDS